MRAAGRKAVVVAAARTPIGRAHKGRLTGVRADDLGVIAARAVLAQVPGLDPTTLDDVYLGASRHTAEQAQNVARRVAVLLELDSVPGVGVSRACASSLQAARMAFHAIRADEGDAFLIGGVESVSRYRPDPENTENPAFAEARARTRETATSNTPWRDPRELGDVPDYYIEMGQTAENVATLCGVTRVDQDKYALLSQQRYAAALASGFVAKQITPVTLPDGAVVSADESPRPATTLEALASLEPVFRANGTVTAGNCCPLSDGAAALLVLSDRRAADVGASPLGRIVATAASATSPEVMGLAPIEATRRVLSQAGFTIDDIDLVELNEAFAAQVLPVQRRLGISTDRLNVHGGAIAMGHPFGMTGARLIAAALQGLAVMDKERALITLCVGTGQGMAMIVERC